MLCIDCDEFDSKSGDGERCLDCALENLGRHIMYRIQRFIPDGQYVAVMPVVIRRPCQVDFMAYEVFEVNNSLEYLKRNVRECDYILREEYFSLPLK